jgi:hypothetical protein
VHHQELHQDHFYILCDSWPTDNLPHYSEFALYIPKAGTTLLRIDVAALTRSISALLASVFIVSLSCWKILQTIYSTGKTKGQAAVVFSPPLLGSPKTLRLSSYCISSIRRILSSSLVTSLGRLIVAPRNHCNICPIRSKSGLKAGFQVIESQIRRHRLVAPYTQYHTPAL